MKRADGRIGHVKKHETLKEVLNPGSKLQNLLQKFNRSWKKNLDNGLGRINSRRSSLKLNMALKITPSNHGMNKFLGGPRPQARTRPQATSAQGTSNKLIGHKPQAWGGSRPQARGSRSLHKVLQPSDRGPLAALLPV